MEYYQRLAQSFKRNAAMRRMHSQGASLAEIGRKYGISRERARQIVNGKKPTNGGRR